MTSSSQHIQSLPTEVSEGTTTSATRALASGVQNSAETQGPGASDAALISRAQSGDEWAFTLLYERHHDAVTGLCRAWLRDAHLAEDAAQETFLKAWRNLAQFTGGTRFSHWLLRIAKNHCHDVWRSSRRAQHMDALPAETIDPQAHARVTACVERMAVTSMLAQLDARDAAFLVERHVNNQPVATLAARWQLTRGSMDVALHRARLRARYWAESQDWRVWLPVPVFRRLQVWLQRLAVDAPGAGCALAVATCHLVAVITMTMPGEGVAYAGPPALADGRSGRSAPPAAGTELPATPAMTAGRNAISSGNETATLRSNATRRQHVTKRPEPPLRFEPIHVPGTAHSAHQKPPTGTKSQEIGSQASVGDHEQKSAVEWHDDGPAAVEPAIDATCTVAKAGAPATYCERR